MSATLKRAAFFLVAGAVLMSASYLISAPRSASSLVINFTPWKVDTGSDWVATSTYTGGNSGWVNTGSVLPAAVKYPATIQVGGYMYAFGGWRTGSTLNTIYRASLSTPTTWVSTGTTLPGAIYGARLAVIGNYIYLFGGYNGSSWSRTIYRASVSDPTTWTNTGALIPVGVSNPGIAVIGGFVYLFGGTTGVSVNTNAIYRAPVSDPLTWTTTGSTIPAALAYSHVAVIGNYVYLFGGLTSAGAKVNTIYRAAVSDPLTWSNTGSTLPVVMAQGMLSIIGDYVYIFGGSSATIYRAPLSAPTAWVSTGSSLPAYLDNSDPILTNGYVYLVGGGDVGGAAVNVIYRAALTLATTVPDAPTTLAASGTTGAVNLTWAAPANDGGAAITNYKIYRSTSAGATTLLTTVGNVLTYSDTSAVAGTLYYYRVTAVNSVGESAYSNEDTGTRLFSAQPPAGTGTALTGWAWSDLIGWISMSCQTGGVASANICATRNYGVAVDGSGNVTGYAWSDAVGWIQFGGLSSFPSGTGTVAQDAAFSSGSLRGWARACEGTATGDCGLMTDRSDGWDGWIALSGSTYGPSLSGSSLTGYAWGGEAMGWIDFSGVSTAYQPCAATQGYVCSADTSVHTGADCSITNDLCTTHGSGWFCAPSNGLCTAPPPPTFVANTDGVVGIEAKPSLVRKKLTTKILWTVTNATTCTITGTNGDSWTATASIAQGTTTSAITQRTVYSIHCTGNGGALDASTVVNIVPEFQER